MFKQRERQPSGDDPGNSEDVLRSKQKTADHTSLRQDRWPAKIDARDKGQRKFCPNAAIFQPPVVGQAEALENIPIGFNNPHRGLRAPVGLRLRSRGELSVELSHDISAEAPSAGLPVLLRYHTPPVPCELRSSRPSLASATKKTTRRTLFRMIREVIHSPHGWLVVSNFFSVTTYIFPPVFQLSGRTHKSAPPCVHRFRFSWTWIKI